LKQLRENHYRKSKYWLIAGTNTQGQPLRGVHSRECSLVCEVVIFFFIHFIHQRGCNKYKKKQTPTNTSRILNEQQRSGVIISARTLFFFYACSVSLTPNTCSTVSAGPDQLYNEYRYFMQIIPKVNGQVSDGTSRHNSTVDHNASRSHSRTKSLEQRLKPLEANLSLPQTNYCRTAATQQASVSSSRHSAADNDPQHRPADSQQPLSQNHAGQGGRLKVHPPLDGTAQ